MPQRREYEHPLYPRKSFPWVGALIGVVLAGIIATFLLR